MLKRNSGFTLIELLIVIAIIAILALIAVPNFLESQVRAKVSRVRADMRSAATALECYLVDYNIYPPRSTTQTTSFWQHYLSTPVAYLSAPMKDPFYSGKEYDKMFYQYASTMMYSTALVSIGPDCLDSWDEVAWKCGNMATYPTKYDPTNGTISYGDIMWFQKMCAGLPTGRGPE